ncbi:MAG: T9SS type A sorting domain-containing protein [candidate division Zixibacteria bacterium]|nr:T9SS type A sorting domain-containing protein [candidate division Zixibacteria bacterium]
MRKIGVLFLMALITISGMANDSTASQRFVLNELFVNTHCHGARDATLYMDSLDVQGVNHFVTLRYHTGFPDPFDPFYNRNPEEIDDIRYWYIIGALPEMLIDGEKAGMSWWNYGRKILEAWRVESPMEINLSGFYNDESRLGVLSIELIATDQMTYDDLRLKVAAYEDSVYYPDPDSVYIHTKTVYDFIPTPGGEEFMIQQGDTLYFNKPFTMPEDADPDMIGFAVWVQAQQSKSVLQTAKIDLPDLEITDGMVDMMVPETDIIIPPEGGRIEYHGRITNRLDEPRSFDVWTVIVHPDGYRQVKLNEWTLDLEPLEQRVYFNLFQDVPGWAPPGQYKFYSYIGNYPNAKSWDMIEFEKAEGYYRFSDGSNRPNAFEIHDVYPNPFNASAVIGYTLANSGRVKADIYNIHGQKIVSLIDEYQDTGLHSVIWNGVDGNGAEVSSGLYFCRLSVGNEVGIKKMTLQK